ARTRYVCWVGTSMGGLLGMLMAAQRSSPVSRLVVNDIGPALEPAALARIGSYVGLDLIFDSFDALEAHIRAVSAPFGALTGAQWEALARSTARALPDGRWKLKYDPGIAVPFRSHSAGNATLWPVWDAIKCPTLVLRGAQSDLLSRETALAMCTRGPRPQLVEFPDVGHAPMLMSEDQLRPLVGFLNAS